MILLRKLSAYLFIFLLFISLYKDLKMGQRLDLIPLENLTIVENDMNNFKRLPIQVEPGDTVLSIVENINHQQLEYINIQEIINDFKHINPFVNPYKLETKKYYFFPLYSK